MTRRQTATVAFIVLCVVLVAAAVSLNVGWILVNGRRVLPLVLGVLAFALIIAGIVVFTVFLVRELRRNEQHDAFINSVTHELKTPIASIRLYLETLQAREVGDQQRKEFYKVMLADAERLQHTVEQVLKAGVAGQRPRLAQRAPVDMVALTRECVETARRRHHLPDEAITLNIPDSQQRLFVSGDVDELRTALSNLLDNAVKYSLQDVQVRVEVAAPEPRSLWVRVRDRGGGIPKSQLKRIFTRFYRLHELPDSSVWFEQPKLVGNEIHLLLHSQPGLKLEMQASTDLIGWSGLEVITNTLGTVEYTNVLTTNFPANYFRTRVLP
jgi:signal transduction histidine kinase